MRHIYLLPTQNCNSDCIYCDIAKTEQIMSPDLLESLYLKLNEFLIGKPQEEITIVWHGGEPLLAGVDFFKKALAFHEKHCRETSNKIFYKIQTNLTLINQDFLNIFRKMGIEKTGTSYDPIPNMRGPRKGLHSKIYNIQFLKAVELLHRNKYEWGVIYTVTRKSLKNPLHIFYFLNNLRPTDGIAFKSIFLGSDDKYNLGITQIEYAEFLGTIFKVWWQNRNKFPPIEPFRSYVDAFKNIDSHFEDSCAYSSLRIKPNGDMYHCHLAIDLDIFSYGNIQDHRFTDIFHNTQRDKIQKRHELLPQTECENCRFWRICLGGCPFESLKIHKNYEDFVHKYDWCDFINTFFKEYLEPTMDMKANFRMPGSSPGCAGFPRLEPASRDRETLSGRSRRP